MKARRARPAGKPAPLLAPLLALLLSLAADCARAAPLAHVFLVQNSGWMEPFYSDPASPYKALITELALAATQAGDALLLAAFNQSQPGAPSPRALLSTTVEPAALRARVVAALAPLDTARKPGGATLADTDLGEALGAAVGGALRRQPGLIWLFTNNRNSPDNDQATARRNREFYQLIHHGAEIDTALAFPLRMPVRGPHYDAGGLMVYVFALHAAGARALEALLASGRIARVLTEPPARLKPLDRDTVRLVAARVDAAPGVRFSMARRDNGGAVLQADMDARAGAPAVRVDWRLENRIYPYTIVGARLSARSTLGGAARPIHLASARIAGLAPGQSMSIGSDLQLPAAPLPGPWSLAALRSAGSAYVLPGAIELRLGEQQLALSPAFRQRMAALFPGDPLPEIFTPPARMQAALAVLPLQVRVHYGIAPLLALLGAALALVAGAAAALLAARRPRKVRLMVDGEPQTLAARAGALQPIFDRAGNKIAELKSTIWGHRILNPRPGARVWLER
jgi:hypothetical protein